MAMADKHTPPTYYWAAVAGGVTGAVGLGGLVIIIVVGQLAGHHAVPVGASGLAASLAICGLLLCVVRLVARPQWVVNRMDAQDQRLVRIKAAVDAHGDNVEGDHTALHEDALDLGAQLTGIRGELGELRALVAEMRHKAQPEQRRHHPTRQRKRRRQGAEASGDNVIPLRARGAADALRRLTERIPDDPNA